MLFHPYQGFPLVVCPVEATESSELTEGGAEMVMLAGEELREGMLTIAEQPSTNSEGVETETIHPELIKVEDLIVVVFKSVDVPKLRTAKLMVVGMGLPGVVVVLEELLQYGRATELV